MNCLTRNALTIAAVLACAGSAVAQHSSIPVGAGPLATTSFGAAGLNLNDPGNGGPVAAGTYVWYSISADWGPSTTASNQWSSEARVILTDAVAIVAGTTVPAPAVIYAGGNAANRGGVAAPNGQGNITARKIGWKGPMATNYTTDGSGTAGLYMYVRQSFASGTNPGVTWANLQVKLFTAAPAAPANDLCSGAVDVSSDANTALASPGVWVSSKVNMEYSGLDGAGALVTQVPEPTGLGTCTTSARKMVWYKYTPANSGPYRISTCTGTDIPNGDDIARSSFAVYTTVDGNCPATSAGLTLLTGSCSTATCFPGGLAGTQVNTQSGSGDLNLVAGTTYYILIGRQGQSSQTITNLIGAQEENYQFSITRLTPPPPPPANDDCVNSIDISAAANAAIGGGGSFLSTPVDMRGASTLSGGDPAFCTAATRSVYYTFTPDTSGLYRVRTCAADAPGNNVVGTVIGIWTGVCGGPYTQLACSSTGCTGGASTTADLTAGTTYRIIVARPSGTLAPAEVNYQFAMDKVTEPACTLAPDRTTNNYFNKATATVANSLTITPGQIICGRTTGTTTVAPMQLGSANYWRLKTAQAGGITRYRLNYNSLTPGHTVTIRGLTQATGGIITAGTDTALQTMSTALNRVQWYGLGNIGDPELFVAVTGTLSTTLNYNLQLQADPVTPITGPNLLPGSITITSVGQTGGTQTDTDMWVYDSDFNPIAGFGNDDQVGLGVGGSTITKTFAPGTYYLAMTRYNFANNQPSLPANDNFTTGAVADFAGVAVQGLIAPALAGDNTGVRFTDSSATPVNVASSVAALGDMNFIVFTVATPASPCNNADIAATDSTPGFDQCVDNGDFSLFFSDFFSADCTATCGILPVVACNAADIAATDSTPGADGCVDNGDFSLFFSDFFSAVCPNCGL